jgi:hypothetical protein
MSSAGEKEASKMTSIRANASRIYQRMFGQPRSRLEWTDPKDLGYEGRDKTQGVLTRLRRSQNKAAEPVTHEDESGLDPGQGVSSHETNSQVSIIL